MGQMLDGELGVHLGLAVQRAFVLVIADPTGMESFDIGAVHRSVSVGQGGHASMLPG